MRLWRPAGLIEKLLNAIGNPPEVARQFMREAASRLSAQAAEIERLKEIIKIGARSSKARVHNIRERGSSCRGEMVKFIENAFYWIHTGEGWEVAKYSCGYFYCCAKDYSTTPSAIEGPLEPPSDNEDAS